MKKILFSLFSLAMFASCSSDMEENVASGDKFNGNVTLISKPFEFEDGTRTSLTNTGSSIEFAWDEDEAIGIFPIAPTTNNQAKQVLNNENCKGTSSTFDGAGWALLKGNTYAAYYPYQDNNYSDYTKISVDMTGQVQDGNGSLAHIGKEFDYMYSVASVPENGIVNFTFDHICAIIMLELTMPEAATWSNIKVANTNNNKVFTTKGTMNVSNGTVTSTSTSTYLDISLNNVNTAAANEKIIVYLAMLPCNPETVVITATSSLGVRYSASITPKAVLAGKAYKWSASFVEVPTNANGHALVDLGLSVKWATMNIGASSPTDYGGYYAWGETVAKTYFDKSNYKHYKSVYISIPIEDEDGFTSFEETEEYGYIKYLKKGDSYYYGFENFYDDKITLDAEDDAATVNWGGSWRMPTNSEIQELKEKCTWTWGKMNNKNGFKVVGPNGNFIFLPAGGWYGGDSYSQQLYFPGRDMSIWSSTLKNSYGAYAVFTREEDVEFSDNKTRYYGANIRAVTK